MRLRSTAGANPVLARAATIDAKRTTRPEGAAQASLALLEPGDSRVDPLVAAAFSHGDVYARKVREVRAKLLKSAREGGAATGTMRLAVLSLHAGDEASILAANLATVFAQMDGPTVLVDADIENPSLDRLMRLPNRIGLAEQLAGMALRLPVLKTAIDRLWLMPGGQAVSGTASLVEKQALAEAASGWNLPEAILIAYLAERPRGGTAFGNILEKFNAVVLVARRGVTSLAEMRRVIDDLDRHRIPIAGSVVC
jgi:Mrp family chromosome partitioning ATPase